MRSEGLERVVQVEEGRPEKLELGLAEHALVELLRGERLEVALEDGHGHLARVLVQVVQAFLDHTPVVGRQHEGRDLVEDTVQLIQNSQPLTQGEVLSLI